MHRTFFFWQMARCCDETAYLVVLKQGAVYVGITETNRPVRVAFSPGTWRPLTAPPRARFIWLHVARGNRRLPPRRYSNDSRR
jgi:DNA-binding IclR family transcriptional regulator